MERPSSYHPQCPRHLLRQQHGRLQQGRARDLAVRTGPPTKTTGTSGSATTSSGITPAAWGPTRAWTSREFHFVNNLWDEAYPGDAQAKSGDPRFVDPAAHTPEGYQLRGDSPARDQGLLLYENPLDFWNVPRPHLPKAGRYDLGAHEFGAAGAAHAGLDRATFPFRGSPVRAAFQSQTPGRRRGKRRPFPPLRRNEPLEALIVRSPSVQQERDVRVVFARGK